MSGPDGVVRVVRGEPRAEELAALLVALGALAGAVTPPRAAPPPSAPWTRRASGLPAAAWLTRPHPAWRAP
ncbi:acyl-CoA carboxylase epsilon subunit [Streptomyces sp. NPDC051776]|uniref:acyl-CoA carboxylase epsilon subunit n=1 Tax=Streptomyces sp. NPDC051776 TaxID=3155414 RepID=UPI0034330C18